MKLFYTSLDTIESVVREQLVPYLMAKDARIITFQGPLGAGKTTVIKIILQILGVCGVTNSPTFSYVNSYKNSSGVIINHFDLYRLNSVQDFYHEALDELLYEPNSYNFIEWPEIIESLLQQKDLAERHFAIKIDYILHKKEERVITCV